MRTDGRTLNATAASLLGLLHEGPMTGWDLLQRAQDRIGDFWTLTQSQVYRELTSMAAAGLVEVGLPGPRDRKPHALTAAGRAAFARWLDQEPGPDQIRIPLLLTVAFADHLSGERLHGIIAARRAEAVERLVRYEAGRDALAGTVDPTRRVTLEYGLRHERAVIEWFDLLPSLLDLPLWEVHADDIP
ncbi:MAG: PadR family transcriptional regulator [Pseudonocardia sp.]|nr:PadR family transcriptional regulator [Pseudonocardia sp.]